MPQRQQRCTWNRASDSALKHAEPECVVLEATGGYELMPLERLTAKSVPVVVVNPRQVRQFARASGRLAKTDLIDAAVLAHYAQAMEPQVRVLPDARCASLERCSGVVGNCSR